MTLPVSQILPAATFRHISVMIGFMIFMSGFSLMGFLCVYQITQSWIHDISHSLSIEIPAYDSSTKTVLTPETVLQNSKKIQNYLKDDPLITGISITQPAPLLINPNGAQLIPAPIFMTINLEKNRAEKSENRIKNNVQKLIPNVLISEKSTQTKNIEHTAVILKTVFCGMTLIILFITGFILSAIIRTLLKVNTTTISLVHLLGAPSGIIASLFKRAITRTSLWGLLCGTLMTLSGQLYLTQIIDFTNISSEFLIGLAVINCGFLVLTRGITHWTVLSSLRTMP